MVIKTPAVFTKELTKLDHEVLISGDRHIEAKKWCEHHLGRSWSAINNRGGIWAVYWHGRVRPYQYRFCFADERDMMWFKLKWQ